VSRALLIDTSTTASSSNTTVRIIPNSEITVYKEDGVTLFDQTMYAGPTGGTTRSNPLTATGSGGVIAYANRPQPVVLKSNGVSYPAAFVPNPDDVPLRSQLPINAKAPPYNLVGDGVVDETLTLQALLDALENDDAVYLPRGTYRITDTLTLSSRSRVEFSGHPGTVISQDTPGEGGIIFTSCDDVLIDSINWQGPGTIGDSAAITEIGIKITGGTTAVISRSKVTDFGREGIQATAGSVTLDTCTIVGTGQSVASSVNVGVVIAGGRSLVVNSRVDNYSEGVSSSSSRTKFLGNFINQDTVAAAVAIGLYTNGFYQMVESNHVYGGIKCSYTADHSVINGNILTGGGNLWLTYCNGGIISNNTVEGGGISLGSDGGGALTDVLLKCYSAQFVHNTLRNSPLLTDGVVTLGAIYGACTGCIFDGNLIEYSAGHGVSLYDASGQALSNNTFRNNIFRKCSFSATGVYDGVKLGSGFGETINGLRFTGNTFDTPVSATSAGAVTTLNSTIISLTSVTEAAKFVPGDRVTGTGIPGGARVFLSGQRIYPTGNPADAGTPGLVLDVAATASGTITLTRVAAQVSDCLDISSAVASTVEVSGNAWGSPTNTRVNLGAILHTYAVNWSHSPLNVGPVPIASSAGPGEVVTTGAVKSGLGLWLGGFTDYHFEMSKLAIANNGIQYVLTDTDPIGLAWVINTASGRTASFSLAGGNATVLLTADATTAGVFSHTATTASKSNVYRDGADSRVKVENKTGGTVTYMVLLFTNRSGSGTF
jgi:parallel beta-helix repeat protein